MRGDLVEMVYTMGPLDARVVTRFAWQRPEWIRYSLVEGPFRALEGEWRFFSEAELTRVELSTRSSRARYSSTANGRSFVT